MPILDRFLAYAQDFERTYVDDDWSRLEQYFTPDATYEVTGATPCLLTGRAAIFRGIKKSLDGFDRKFVGRNLEVEGTPKAEGDTVMVDWLVTYERPGAPALPLRGRSIARFAGDTIAQLKDVMAADDSAAKWFAKYGAGLNSSYV
jgi:hypothetical protein